MHQRKTEVVNKLVGGVKAIVKSARATSIFGEAKFLGLSAKFQLKIKFIVENISFLQLDRVTVN